MWKKNDISYPQPEPAATPQQHNSPVEQLRERAIIGSSIVVKGEISGDEDLMIQGQVEGRVELRQHNVTVGKNGRVKADIFGKIISIEGEVRGNVFGEEKIVIRSTGVLHGNITAPRVTLEDGSKFKGAIDMDAKEPEKPAKPIESKSIEAKPAAADVLKPAVMLADRSTEDGKKLKFDTAAPRA